MLHLSFYLRRLHSLTGLFILGEYLLSHIFANVYAVLYPHAIPPENPVPTLFVLVILLFHTVYGVYIALQANCNARHYPWMFNVQFSLQRFSAWYLTAFLLWHVLYLRIIVTGFGAHISISFLQDYLANPVYWLLYLLGMWAAVFHFCNGITTFSMTWGIAKGPRCQRVISYGAMGLCTLLCAISLGFMLFYLA